MTDLLKENRKLKEILQKEHGLLDKVHEVITKIVWEDWNDEGENMETFNALQNIKKQIEDFKLFNDLEITKLLQ